MKAAITKTKKRPDSHAHHAQQRKRGQGLQILEQTKRQQNETCYDEKSWVANSSKQLGEGVAKNHAVRKTGKESFQGCGPRRDPCGGFADSLAPGVSVCGRKKA